MHHAVYNPPKNHRFAALKELHYIIILSIKMIIKHHLETAQSYTLAEKMNGVPFAFTIYQFPFSEVLYEKNERRSGNR